MKSVFNGRSKVEVSRFKGLGEMTAPQLKETTMDPRKRTMLASRSTRTRKARPPTSSSS